MKIDGLGLEEGLIPYLAVFWGDQELAFQLHASDLSSEPNDALEDACALQPEILAAGGAARTGIQ